MTEEKPFSVITLNWNRCRDLDELLRSLRNQYLKNFEIIVVDNGSTDGSLNMVRQRYPEAKLISLTHNIGIHGFNIGARMAAGKYLILLDNDTILPPTFFQSVKELVKQYPGFTAYALNIVNSNGKSQSDYLPGEIESPVEWHNFIGGGAVFKAEDYRELCGYDPKYFIYINETELAARICLAGKKILYCPQIKVIHKTSQAARLTKANYFYYVRNSILFMKTYFEFSHRWDLIIGFLTINLRKSLEQRSMRCYLRAILQAWRAVPSHKPARKLRGDLVEEFSKSWQGNPSFTQVAKRKLWKRFR
jgi:GT2 family glycosyltransferase